MPKIRPVSDLRNYASILSDVSAGEPVYLTKNGRGAYAVVSIDDQEKYEKAIAYAKLMEELNKGLKSYSRGEVISEKEILSRIDEEWDAD